MGVPTDYRAEYEPQGRALIERGLSIRSAAERLGIPESTLGAWLRTKPKRRATGEPAQILYDAICWYKFNNDGNSPSRHELCKLVGYGTGHVHTLLKLLERRGWITINANNARGINVVGSQWIPPSRYQNATNKPPIRQSEPYRMRRTQREALRKAKRLCECERGEIRWVKMIQQGKRKPEPMYMCEYCADAERETIGDDGLEPFSA